MDVWWLTLVAPIGVFLGAVLGLLGNALLSPHVTSNLQQRQWLRDQRLRVYLQAVRHARHIDAHVDRWTDDEYGLSEAARYTAGEPGEPLLSREEVTAALDLLAPDLVKDAWRELITSYEAAVFNGQQDPPSRIAWRGGEQVLVYDVSESDDDVKRIRRDVLTLAEVTAETLDGKRRR